MCCTWHSAHSDAQASKLSDYGQIRVGLFASILSGIGEAISDVRHKVVEEGWFGRQVTDANPLAMPEITAPEISPPVKPEGSVWEPPRQSFEEAWATKLSPDDPSSVEPGRDAPGLDR